MTARIVPFPASAKIGPARRSAAAALNMGPEAAEKHILHQARRLEESLLKSGVELHEAIAEARQYEALLRAEMWRQCLGTGLRPGGGAA